MLNKNLLIFHQLQQMTSEKMIVTGRKAAVGTAKAAVLGSDNATSDVSNEDKKNNWLYIRYRNRSLPSREEIRKLHCGIVDVRFPRQKHVRYGWLQSFYVKYFTLNQIFCEDFAM